MVDCEEKTDELLMPVVCPVPIKTKGKPWYRRMFLAFKPRSWKLMQDFKYRSPGMALDYLIPAPFIFDFASVPRPFWIILDPTGLLLIGSSFHDFGYRYGGLFVKKFADQDYQFRPYTRLQLDAILERITREVNDMSVMARIARVAVRIGGYFAWRGNRKDNRNVFVDYPEMV